MNDGAETIIDTKTQETVPIVSSKGFLEVKHLYDSMDRGNHDYEGTLVVDPTYYNKNDFKRGEVVYYNTTKTGHKNIARVVGLPGEKIEIKKGQLFINDKRLKSFYESTMNRGISNFTTYKKMMETNGNRVLNEKGWKTYFYRNLKPVEVKKNEVFVLGDNSWRALDSFSFGPLARDNVEGKVLGIRLINKE
jgi:signal peptidase I